METTSTTRKATIVPLLQVQWDLDVARPVPIIESKRVFLEDLSGMLKADNFDLWKEYLSESQRKQVVSAKVGIVHRFESSSHIGKEEHESKSLLEQISACLQILRPTRSRFQTIQLKFLSDSSTDIFRFSHPQETLPNIPQSDILNTIRAIDIERLHTISPRFLKLAENGPENVVRAARYFLIGYSEIVDNFISSLVTSRIIKHSKKNRLPTFSEVFSRFFDEEDEIVELAKSFEDNIEGYMEWIGPDELRVARDCFEEIRSRVLELLGEGSNAK
ncbi:MAG: hypothetical protein WCA10_05310 [Terracidiphilus sp.]